MKTGKSILVAVAFVAATGSAFITNASDTLVTAYGIVSSNCRAGTLIVPSGKQCTTNETDNQGRCQVQITTPSSAIVDAFQTGPTTCAAELYIHPL